MKTRVEKIDEFLKTINVENLDLLNCIGGNDEVESFDDIYDAIENSGGFDVEIIYYGIAMQYLAKYDTSLRESLEIASDMGYELKDLSSEILASLLASQRCREDFESWRDTIDEFFGGLEDDEEC